MTQGLSQYSSDYIRHLASLALDNEVFLYELSNYNLANRGEVYYFTNTIGVSFGNQIYNTIGCKLSGFDIRSQGVGSQASMTVLDPLNLISSFQRLEGARLRVKVTHRRFLDDMPTRDVNAIKYETKYRVSQITNQVYGEKIEFKLMGLLAGSNSKIGRPCVKSCTHVYRDQNCRYTGVNYFDYNNRRTTDRNNDNCRHDAAACGLRNNQQNYGGSTAVGDY